MMSELYPHCDTCGTALSVRVGLKRGDLRFCNPECERGYYKPPREQAATEEAVLYGALEILRQHNPRLTEKSLLALHYLGWDKIPPRKTKDYSTFQEVRSWVK